MKVGPEKLRSAAYAAVDARVESGMVVGLGSGSTASWAVRRIGELLSSGELENVRGIPTSETTARLALEVGIPLVGLSEARPDKPSQKMPGAWLERHWPVASSQAGFVSRS